MISVAKALEDDMAITRKLTGLERNTLVRCSRCRNIHPYMARENLTPNDYGVVDSRCPRCGALAMRLPNSRELIAYMKILERQNKNILPIYEGADFAAQHGNPALCDSLLRVADVLRNS